ncbi:hypothetical protein DPSP01_000775 [Paraphaeosphaeria sporulosa]
MNQHDIAVHQKVVTAWESKLELLGTDKVDSQKLADNDMLVMFLEAELETILEHKTAQKKEIDRHLQKVKATEDWLMEKGVDMKKRRYPESFRREVSRAPQTDGV